MFKRKEYYVKIQGLAVNLTLENVEQPYLMKALTESPHYKQHAFKVDAVEEYYTKCTNITKPQYKVLKALAPHIQYRNVLLLSREELSGILNTCTTNLSRKLKLCKPFIKATSVETGYVRIVMHPELAFVYESELFREERELSIQHYQEGYESE